MQLSDKMVVVLGGSTGMGFATARAALAENARVLITGRSAEKLKRAGEELGQRAQTLALDVADEAGTQALFAGLDRVDHVFVTAATVVFGANLDSETARMRPSLDTRFWGSLYAAKYAAPKMTQGGSITFMSGTSAWRPRRGSSVGSASCGAIEAFGRSLAVELAPIRVNTIAPGLIDTPLIDEVMGSQRDAIIAQDSARVPVGRIGRADEIADAVLFLMKNEFVTGITLTVDGGRSLV